LSIEERGITKVDHRRKGLQLGLRQPVVCLAVQDLTMLPAASFRTLRFFGESDV
jgi:hypothetical protein